MVIFVSYTSDAILYMKTMQNLEYLPPMVIGDDAGFSDPSFLESVADIAQGAINRSAWSAGEPGSVTYKLNEMFKEKTGRDIDDTTGRAMQGFFVLADAINRAGSTDAEAIRQALAATDLGPSQLMMGFEGVKFDEKGQNVLATTLLIQLKGDEYVAVWPETRPWRRSSCRSRVGSSPGPSPGHSERPPDGGRLRTLFVRPHADLGHDERDQLRPWRSGHDRHVHRIWTYVLLGGGPAVFGPLAAILLFLFGVLVYFALIRHVIDGPIISQILATFGLALLLRYAAFWAFSADFVTLPDTLLISGNIDIGGILIELPRLVAGVVALAVTVGMHLLLTRTTSAASCSPFPRIGTRPC